MEAKSRPVRSCPTDVNGNPVEPFIIDGTTYLPLRGVLETLGYEVRWDGKTNTVEIGFPENREDGAEIVTPYMYSEVLRFTRCNGVTLRNLRAGHSVTGDYQCDAGVLTFEHSQNIEIDGGYLYGSGAWGLNLMDCRAVEVRDTVITDCSLRAVGIYKADDVAFDGCKFVDNRAYNGTAQYRPDLLNRRWV